MKPICGWPAIAKAVGKALGGSVSVRTAQRYARSGRTNRLPVFSYDNSRVYLMPSALRLWKRARAMPLGGRLPGAHAPRCTLTGAGRFGHAGRDATHAAAEERSRRGRALEGKRPTKNDE